MELNKATWRAALRLAVVVSVVAAAVAVTLGAAVEVPRGAFVVVVVVIGFVASWVQTGRVARGHQHAHRVVVVPVRRSVR